MSLGLLTTRNVAIIFKDLYLSESIIPYPSKNEIISFLRANFALQKNAETSRLQLQRNCIFFF